MPSGFAVGSSPVTTSGTLAVTTTLNGPVKGNGSGFTAGAINLTSEVTGTLPIANGGTNTTATPTNGGVAYGTGSAYAFTAAGASGQVLRSNGAAAPTWADAGSGLIEGTGISINTNTINTVWTVNGTHIYNNNAGNVGVGVTNPTSYKFEVAGESRASGNVLTGVHFVSQSGDPYFRTDANNKHIVLSGGSGWAATGATMVLRGATAGSNAHGLEIYTGGAERVRINSSGHVGIGTPSPNQTLQVHGNTLLANSAGTQHTWFPFTNGYNYITADRTFLRAADYTTFGSVSNMGINMVQTVSANALNVRGYQYVAGPGQVDNQDHQMNCSPGFAMVNMSVYVSSRFEGDLRANCANLPNVLNGSWYWQTSQHGCGNADNTWYDLRCPANHLMSGFIIYATGQLDYCPRILCQALINGATTSGSFMNADNGVSGPSNPTGPDNMTYTTTCPPGSYLTGISYYASSHADGGLYSVCSGINMPY
jgi:hypothetical protein